MPFALLPKEKKTKQTNTERTQNATERGGQERPGMGPTQRNAPARRLSGVVMMPGSSKSRSKGKGGGGGRLNVAHGIIAVAT